MSGFRVYATMDQRMPLSRVAAHAGRAEALGYDGLCVPDAVHDGLSAATIALHATERLHVATSVLVAFPRSPMTVAIAAWDLQELSGGRFELGMGSQVRGNIVGRYSTAWTPPVPRMREYVGALRAIFECWRDGAELQFEGDHYRFTRMQPFFRPDPITHPHLPIYTGGIGPGMLTLAGEVADGLITHPTNTAPRYLREEVLPRLSRGAQRADRHPSDVALLVGPLVSTGPDAEAVASAREETRRLLAFLYSTPAYWPSLALFGWQDRGEELHGFTRDGRWAQMPGAVSDEMLDTFSPSATYGEIARVLHEWYGQISPWITFPVPAEASHDDEVRAAIARLRAGPA